MYFYANLITRFCEVSISFRAWGLSECSIDGLQPIPRESVTKGMTAMLVEQTKEVLEKSFVFVHQHDGDDITCKP